MNEVNQLFTVNPGREGVDYFKPSQMKSWCEPDAGWLHKPNAAEIMQSIFILFANKFHIVSTKHYSPWAQRGHRAPPPPGSSMSGIILFGGPH